MFVWVLEHMFEVEICSVLNVLTWGFNRIDKKLKDVGDICQQISYELDI